MTSVIVHGPQGSGKTKNAEKIRKHFGLKTIVDGWSPDQPILISDALLLTNCAPKQLEIYYGKLKVVDIKNLKTVIGNG